VHLFSHPFRQRAPAREPYIDDEQPPTAPTAPAGPGLTLERHSQPIQGVFVHELGVVGAKPADPGRPGTRRSELDDLRRAKGFGNGT